MFVRSAKGKAYGRRAQTLVTFKRVRVTTRLLSTDFRPKVEVDAKSRRMTDSKFSNREDRSRNNALRLQTGKTRHRKRWWELQSIEIGMTNKA